MNENTYSLISNLARKSFIRVELTIAPGDEYLLEPCDNPTIIQGAGVIAKALIDSIKNPNSLKKPTK